MPYSRRRNMGGIFSSASLGLSHMFLAAVTVIVLFYAIKYSDKHAILCTLGQQFISGVAILSTEIWSGDRQHYTHASLHVLGLLLAIVGIVVIDVKIDDIKVPNHDHGRAGYIGLICTIINAVTGPLSYCLGNCWWWVHVLLGTVAFISSSVSLGLALWMALFKAWAGEGFVIFLLVLIVLYTLDITLSCCSRLF